MKKTLICIILLASSILTAETIEIDRRDYISLIVGNYVHGFNRFDTGIVSFNNSVSISIYYDENKQSRVMAERLAERFEAQIPLIFKHNGKLKDVKVIVNVYTDTFVY